MKVFLGGTCNNSTWREIIMPMFDESGIDYFNPVVEHWTEEDIEIEEREKSICDCQLFVITPKMLGVYSIAEVVQSSNDKPENTILVILEEDGEDVFIKAQLKSLVAVMDLVKNNGAEIALSLDEGYRLIRDRMY